MLENATPQPATTAGRDEQSLVKTTMNTDKTAAQPVITLDQLTPEQVKALRKQMNEARKQASGDRDAWNAIVDAMLQEREGDGFAHTTSDILARLQASKVIPATLDTEARQNQLKKVQTRKQLLEKKRDEAGKLLFSVGYKPSASGFNAILTIARVEEWLKETATAAELATLAKLIKATKGQ